MVVCEIVVLFDLVGWVVGGYWMFNGVVFE